MTASVSSWVLASVSLIDLNVLLKEKKKKKRGGLASLPRSEGPQTKIPRNPGTQRGVQKGVLAIFSSREWSSLAA